MIAVSLVVGSTTRYVQVLVGLSKKVNTSGYRLL
jgi:hypothetical protein